MQPVSNADRSQSQSEAPQLGPDRRRFRRVELSLLGRFMRQNREETPCRLVDISVGGAYLQAPLTVEAGEKIVAYFDELGRLEGHVVRRLEGGFTMEFIATPRKREKLAEQLTWLINRNLLGLPDERRHDRTVPARKEMILYLPDGVQAPCTVMDVSVSGASVYTDATPELGTDVILGRMRGRVVRHHEGGVGVEFTDLMPSSALKQHFD